MDTIELQWFSRKKIDGQPDTFLEFFINGRPLSEVYSEFHQLKTSLLDNWTGVLGSFPNSHAEIITVKHLLSKTVTEKEFRAAFPQNWTESELEWHLDKYKEELADPEILIYCCPICGDHDCGGIATRIIKTDETVIWTIIDERKDLTFEFNKYAYFDAFNARLNYLQKKNKPRP